MTETTFEPDRPVTRAEFAALIVRALNLNAATEGQQWKDVAANDWFASSVYAAANVGLIAGYDGWFRPDDLITREEMAVVIAKAYAFKGGNPSSGAIDMFADRNEISDWAYSYVDTTAAIGILKGITRRRLARLLTQPVRKRLPSSRGCSICSKRSFSSILIKEGLWQSAIALLSF